MYGLCSDLGTLHDDGQMSMAAKPN